MHANAIINYKYFKSYIKNQEFNKNFINFLLNTFKVGLDFISMGNKFQSLGPWKIIKKNYIELTKMIAVKKIEIELKLNQFHRELE